MTRASAARIAAAFSIGGRKIGAITSRPLDNPMPCCNKLHPEMAQNKISLRRLGLGLACIVALAGCKASPLYFSTSNKRPGTGGEIPRDGRGEPIWAAIRPITPPAVAAPPAQQAAQGQPAAAAPNAN